jgi:hypothetical protein
MERNGLQSTFSVIFAASFLAFFGCSTIGKTVPLEKRIPLVSERIQKGEQVAEDARIIYTYRLYERMPDLSGLLEIKGTLHWYSLTNSLNVWINFLDSEGKIIKRRDLARYREGPSGRFQEKLEVPTGTAGISFGALTTTFY